MTAEPLWPPPAQGTETADERALAPSFETLYREHHARLYRFCLGMTRTHAVAEDIAQEALLRAFLHWDDLDPARSPWPWLKKVATRLVYDHSRPQRAVPQRDPAEAGVVRDIAATYVERDFVRQMLGSLTERQRAAVSLRYLDDWKSAEIAAVLDLPRPAVEQLLLRARRSLKTEYRRLSGDRLRLVLWPLLAWAQRVRQRTARGIELVGDRALPSLAATAESMSALMVAGALTVGGAVATQPSITTVEASGQRDRLTTLAPRPPKTFRAAADGRREAPSGDEPSAPARPDEREGSRGPAPAQDRVVLNTDGGALDQGERPPLARASTRRDDKSAHTRGKITAPTGAGSGFEVYIPCKNSAFMEATCTVHDATVEAIPDS